MSSIQSPGYELNLFSPPLTGLMLSDVSQNSLILEYKLSMGDIRGKVKKIRRLICWNLKRKVVTRYVTAINITIKLQ
jgi:hypothetical protein